MPALAIRQDLPAAALRRLARHKPDRHAAMRLMTIARTLDGFSHAKAARLAGMECQAPSPPAAQARPGCTPAHTLGGANPTTSAGSSRAARCTPSRVASGHHTAYLAPKSPTRSDPYAAQQGSSR
jgi:hypothetical protein